MSGSSEQAMVKLKAGLAATVGTAGGLVYGPLLVQAAIVAVLVCVVVVFGLAHAHDMTVGRAAALYGGRAILALAKGTAISLVEWPLRAGHRANAHFDLALRVQLGAARAAYRVGDRGDATAARARSSRPLLTFVGHPESAVEVEDRPPLAVVRRGA